MTRSLLDLLERAPLGALAERHRSDDPTNLRALFPPETLALVRAIASEAPLEPPGEGDDPRPIVVLVPGLFGSHLAERDGTRIATHALSRAVTRRLALAPPAWTAPYEQSDVVPDGVLHLAYGPAITAWRLCGLVVEAIPLDWRRDVRDEARRFDVSFRAIRARHPGRRVILVAHSSGGLVASAWAQRPDAALDAIAHVAFVSVPLGGTFDAIAAHLGEPWLPHAIGFAEIDETLDDVRALARSLPGLAQLFPHRGVLAADGVDQDSRWPVDLAPHPTLRAMRDALHETLHESPLVRRAARFHSTWYPTRSGLGRDERGVLRTEQYGAGDFTAPLASLRAAPAGMPTYTTSVWHPQAVLDPVVIAKVLEWAHELASAHVGAGLDAVSVAAEHEAPVVAPTGDPRFESLRPPEIGAPATEADAAILAGS